MAHGDAKANRAPKLPLTHSSTHSICGLGAKEAVFLEPLGLRVSNPRIARASASYLSRKLTPEPAKSSATVTAKVALRT